MSPFRAVFFGVLSGREAGLRAARLANGPRRGERATGHVTENREPVRGGPARRVPARVKTNFPRATTAKAADRATGMLDIEGGPGAGSFHRPRRGLDFSRRYSPTSVEGGRVAPSCVSPLRAPAVVNWSSMCLPLIGSRTERFSRRPDGNPDTTAGQTPGSAVRFIRPALRHTLGGNRETRLSAADGASCQLGQQRNHECDRRTRHDFPYRRPRRQRTPRLGSHRRLEERQTLTVGLRRGLWRSCAGWP